MDGDTQTVGTVLPDELIEEILSSLSVKSLMRFTCANKYFKSLISDPFFIKMHFDKSARNPRLILPCNRELFYSLLLTHDEVKDYRLLPMPVSTISSVFSSQPKATDDEQTPYVVGSCNGVLCLLFTNDYREISLCLWNPSTRTKSKKIGFYRDSVQRQYCHYSDWLFMTSFRFSFGYDVSSGIYKIVAFQLERNDVRVFSFGGDGWRNIQGFPVVPFQRKPDVFNFHPGLNDGVYLCGTINWLTIGNKFMYDCADVTVDEFVIVSLDLGTERYRQLMLPQGFDEVPFNEPCITVLMDCLCFSYDFKDTHFVIWRMTEFGVEESWTQFLKIDYQNLQLVIDGFYGEQHFCLIMHPLGLSENDNTVLLAVNLIDEAVLYNWKENTVKKVRIYDNKIWWFCAKVYVESLVSVC